MRLKFILLFVLITVLSNGVYAQLDNNIKAKLYFTEAQKLYEQGDFENSLKYINKAENTLGTTVARTLALKIKTQYNLGNFIKAKELLDNYTANYMQGASEELNNEVLELFINIEEAAKAEIANRKKAEIANRKKDSIKRIAKEEDYFYKKVQRTNTIEAYEKFLDKFPSSDRKYSIKDMIEEKKEQILTSILKVDRTDHADPLIDPRDGQSYKTVNILGNIIMAENLNYRTRGSYENNIRTNNPKKYGRLYTFKAAQKACPPGWELPDLWFWTELTGDINFYYAMRHNNAKSTGREGQLLKASSGWEIYREEQRGYNSFGFSAFPVGYAVYETKLFKDKLEYHMIGAEAYFWTSTTYKHDKNLGMTVKFQVRESKIYFERLRKDLYAIPCRCVKKD